jgi:basic amino acid/polyamine antiporter, APA family
MGAAARQTPGLRRVMKGTEYFTLAFGSIVGVGWMVVMEEWLTAGGPLGAILAFLVGGLALVPVALVYGRLAQRIPEAASEIAYTAAVFPPVVSFLTGWTMTFAYLVVCPFEAVAIGRLIAYTFPALNSYPLYQVGEHWVYLPHLFLGIALTICITLINVRGIRFSARFQTWTTFGLLAVFCLFAPLGWWHGQLSQMQPLFAQGSDWVGALLSTMAVLPIVPYFLTGFETIPKCAEEAAEGFEVRRFGPIMVLALILSTLFYTVVITVVAMLYPWRELKGQDFATAIAFRAAFGSEWLVRLLLLGAALSLLKVFNGMFLGSTRLLYAMGRRGLLASSLGTVDPHWGTPNVAIALVSTITLLAGFLGRAVLGPIAQVGSLAGALGWLAACLALFFGAGGEIGRRARALAMGGAVVSLALVIVAAWSFVWFHWLAIAVWLALGLLPRKTTQARDVEEKSCQGCLESRDDV